MPSNPIYDARTPHYREGWKFPPNETAWWKKNNKNHVVRAVIAYALSLKKPFKAQKVYEEARYYNGNLVKNSGMLSPTKEKVMAMIRYCGYFKSTTPPQNKVRIWRKK